MLQGVEISYLLKVVNSNSLTKGVIASNAASSSISTLINKYHSRFRHKCAQSNIEFVQVGVHFPDRPAEHIARLQ